MTDSHRRGVGGVLARFGVCPGGIFIDFLLVFVLFRGNRLDKLSRRVLVATRRDLNILPWVLVWPDAGSAAEAWAVPCTFRTEVPEISKKSNVTFFR